MTEPILQASCVQQRLHATKGKLDWEVFDNKNNKLYELPKELNDPQIFAIQDYVRKFELNAFNQGAEEMKNELIKKFNEQKALWEFNFKNLKSENERLSAALNKLVGLSIEDDDDPSSKIGIPSHMR